MLQYKIKELIKAKIKFHRLWHCAQAETPVIAMLNIKSLFGSILNQGKRAVLRSYIQKNTGFKNNKKGYYSKAPYKLNEVRSNYQLAIIDASQQHSSLGVIRRFVNVFLQRVVTPRWGNRNQQFSRLLGNVSPFFSLVGVTLAANSSEKGFITVHDEVESLCDDIREAVSRAGIARLPNHWNFEPKSEANEDSLMSLNNFKLGPIIDKGCNAVVYAANLKSENCEDMKKPEPSLVTPTEEDTPLLSSQCKNKKRTFHLPFTKKKKNKTSRSESCDDTCDLVNKKFEEYPLAVKMMFNYEAESNFGAILTAMHREVLPAAKLQLGKEMSTFKLKFGNKQIPGHSNIVEMPFVFVDRIPMLPGADDLYPNALPKRLHNDGYGRNMSLFCVMKRYDCTLGQYLAKGNLDTKTSFLLLAQLLEAVLHLNSLGVSHRDLKMDNVLITLQEGWCYPKLVVTDFGCCLCGQPGNLRVPFATYEADPRLGNAALMAPEVKNSLPGMLRSIDYAKNDLWAAGILALDMFNICNGFNSAGKNLLDSATYNESDIAKLTKTLPIQVRHLLMDLLKRDPKERPSVVVAATICQLNLWAPTKWISSSSRMPSYTEISEWLLCLSTKVLCEIGTSTMFDSFPNRKKVDNLEYEIVYTFLKRVRYEDVVSSLKWIKSV